MPLDEQQTAELVFPTKWKSRIGSYLSWPVGALTLTKAFCDVPQAKQMQVEFHEHWPKYRRGKWPVSFAVIEVRYERERTRYSVGERALPQWVFRVYPVPREMKAEIREAFETQGSDCMVEWLTRNAGFAGREGNLSFTGIWNSEIKKLKFGVRGTMVPEVTTDSLARHKADNS